jgi:hypothetical protein
MLDHIKTRIYKPEAVARGAIDNLMSRMILMTIDTTVLSYEQPGFVLMPTAKIIMECFRQMDACNDPVIAIIICAAAGLTQTTPAISRMFAMRHFSLDLMSIETLVRGFPQGIPVEPGPLLSENITTQVPTMPVAKSTFAARLMHHTLTSLDPTVAVNLGRMLTTSVPGREEFTKKTEKRIQQTFTVQNHTIGRDVSRFVVSKYL